MANFLAAERNPAIDLIDAFLAAHSHRLSTFAVHMTVGRKVHGRIMAGAATYRDVVGTSTLVPSAALRRAASRTVAVATASQGSTGTGPLPRTAPANCA